MLWSWCGCNYSFSITDSTIHYKHLIDFFTMNLTHLSTPLQRCELTNSQPISKTQTMVTMTSQNKLLQICILINVKDITTAVWLILERLDGSENVTMCSNATSPQKLPELNQQQYMMKLMEVCCRLYLFPFYWFRTTNGKLYKKK